MKNIDVTALGEVLIDFTFAGQNEEGKNLYEENIGGAPANAASAVAKLGGKSAFIGMTGNDSFGKDIKKCLEDLKVETKGMKTTDKQHTTLAFVTLDSNGERHFSFCRNPGADTQLSVEDLDMDLLKNTKILHVGSLSLTDSPSKEATLQAIKIVKQTGGLISYDPNWRANLWTGRKDALDELRSLFKYADIVKISDEEMRLLFGEGTECKDAAEKIRSEGVSLVMITLGAAGVYYSCGESCGVVGCKKVNVVDTTGAGDSFNGGILYRLTLRGAGSKQCEQALTEMTEKMTEGTDPLVNNNASKDFFKKLTKQELETDLSFANAVASLCVTKRGAIPALPSLSNVEDFIQNQ